MAERTEERMHAPVLVLDQWCIYRVPSQLRNVDEAAYTPQSLSIGPFHHGNPNLRDMEAHKKKCYERFRVRSSKSEDELRSFILYHQQEILNCYAGAYRCDIDFVDVVLVDACFIIELFLSNAETESPDENYYILKSPWLRKAVERDLILFENQLPYSLLEKLYHFVFPAASCNGHPEKGVRSQEHSIQSVPFEDQFLELTCKFFTEYSKEKSVRNRFKPKHFTDLVRHFLCPYNELSWVNNYNDPIKIKHHARNLKAAGVMFMPLREPFVIKEDPNKLTFNLACSTHKALKLTRLWAEYDAECIFRNTMALEQLMYPKEPYICSYFLLMHQLIDTEEDVDVLIEDGVIINLLGSSKAVAQMISSLCEHIKDEQSCYADICHNINKHYKMILYHPLVIMKLVYFKDLWRASTAILGFVVLVFSILTSLKTFELL